MSKAEKVTYTIHVDTAKRGHDKTVQALLKVVDGEIKYLESYVLQRRLTRDQRKFIRFLRSIGVNSELPIGFMLVHRGRGKYKVAYTPYDHRGMKRSTRRKITS